MSDTSTNQTHTKTLAERIEEGYADAWRPAAGDSLVGFVQDITTGTTDYGDYPIVTVVKDDGNRASVHAFHSVLQEALILAEPAIGEEIAVKYEGLRVPKKMLTKSGAVPDAVNAQFDTKDDPRYHDYKVLVSRAPADVWGKFRKARDEK